MIKYVSTNIEQYFEHIKKFDVHFTQLKKGVFYNEVSLLYLKTIIIQYVKSCSTSKAYGVLPKDYYAFSIINSQCKQTFNGCTLESDSIIILEPQTEGHRISHGNYDAVLVHIPKELVEKNFNSLKTGVYKVHNKKFIYRLQYILNRLIYVDTTNNSFSRYYYQLILLNLDTIISQIIVQYIPNHYYYTFTKISQFMKNNYKSNLSVPEIAKHFNITDRTLRNIFVEQTSISPKQFQKAIQITAFKDDLLQNPKDNISTIMIRNGMEHQSQVIKDFKSFFQKTPTKYRT